MSCSKCSGFCKTISSIKVGGGAGVLLITYDNNQYQLAVLGREAYGSYQGLGNIFCGKMDPYKDCGCHLYTAWREFCEESKYKISFSNFMKKICAYIVHRGTPVFILVDNNLNTSKLDKQVKAAYNNPSLDPCLREMSGIQTVLANANSNRNLSPFTQAILGKYTRNEYTHINQSSFSNNNNIVIPNNNIVIPNNNIVIPNNNVANKKEEIRIFGFNKYRGNGVVIPSVLAFPNGKGEYGFPYCPYNGNPAQVSNLLQQFGIPQHYNQIYRRFETSTQIVHAYIIACNGLSRSNCNSNPEWFDLTDVLNGNAFNTIVSIHDSNKTLSKNSLNIVVGLANTFRNF